MHTKHNIIPVKVIFRKKVVLRFGWRCDKVSTNKFHVFEEVAMFDSLKLSAARGQNFVSLCAI